MSYTRVNWANEPLNTALPHVDDAVFDSHEYGGIKLDTLADLRALTPPSNANATRLVLGRDAAGDGGGGLYYYSLTSTALDDSANAVRPNAVSSGAAGRWLRASRNATSRDVVALDTIADLRAVATTDLLDNTVRMVCGYYAIGDTSAPAFYRWDADLTAKTFTGDATTDTLTISGGHTFKRGQKVVVYGATLPAGLTQSTVYWVTAVSGTTLKLSPTWEGAYLTTPTVVNFTTTATGSINYADDGGFRLAATSTPQNGRWVRMLLNDWVSLRSFGAQGNDVADDTLAMQYWLQAALNDECRATHKLYIEKGVYRITQTTKLIASALTIEGHGVLDDNSTSLNWAGNSTDPMFDMHCINCNFRNFMIHPGAPLHAGVRFARWTNNAAGFVPSHNNFERVFFLTSQSSGTDWFTYCVEFEGTALANTVDNNNEGHRFDYCSFNKYTEAAIHFHEYSQAKSIYFNECQMTGWITNGNYGIKGSGSGSMGSFIWQGGMGGYHAISDFHLGPTSEFTSIEGYNSENSNRMLTTAFTGQGLQWLVAVRGCRFDTNVLAADGEYIQFGYNGPLEVSGNYIRSANTAPAPQPKIRLSSYGDATHFGTIRHYGNHYFYNVSSGTIANAITVTTGSWAIDDGCNLINQMGVDMRVLLPRQGVGSVGSNRGDASVTLLTHDEETQLFTTQLTANRTVTLPAAAFEGKTFRIVRNATTPGAFTLTVQTATPTTVKQIPTNTNAAVTVRYDGSAWQLIGYGVL